MTTTLDLDLGYPNAPVALVAVEITFPGEIGGQLAAGASTRRGGGAGRHLDHGSGASSDSLHGELGWTRGGLAHGRAILCLTR